MRFVNSGPNRRITLGPSEKRWRVGLQTGQEIDLPRDVGERLGLDEVTEGKIGETKVETKQFEPNPVEKKNEDFQKKLRDIDGIGQKTAEDIMEVYSTEEEIIKAIKSKEHLPFRDDVERKLRRKYK